MKTFASVLSVAALSIAASFSVAGTTSAAESVVPEPVAADSSESVSVPARCFERGELLFDLATTLGERLKQSKRVGERGLLEAFTLPTDGTWTIVYSDGDARSCIIASGDGLPVAAESDEMPRGGWAI